VFDQKQMDQWKQQIEQMQDLGFHQMV